MQTPEYQQQPQTSYPFSQHPSEGNYTDYQQPSQLSYPQQPVQPLEGNHPGYQPQTYAQYAQQRMQPPMYAPQQPPAQQPYYQQQPSQQQFMPPTQPYQQPFPFAQPYQQPPAPYMPNMVNNVNINVQQKGHGFLIRAIYFVCVGWWLGLFWLHLGFALCALVITLPVGLIMLNRLPQILTLKPAGTSTQVNISSTVMQGTPGDPAMMVNNINVNVGGTLQHNFLIRALYFVFIGCWLGYIWASLAYLCFVSIVLIPVGILMLDKLPAVLTLRKN